MTKKRTENKEPDITLLKKPRSVFKQELEDRITIGQALYEQQVLNKSQLDNLKNEYVNWDDYNEELLKRSFNKKNNEYFNDYHNCAQWIGVDDVLYRRNIRSEEYKINHEKKRISASLKTLQRLVEKLPLIEEMDEISSFSARDKIYTNKCFIIHGHDDMRKYEVARFIENELRLKTIILHEQPNKGRTIIEKFVDHSTVDFAIALWTSDDQGRANLEKDLKSRARQNVIFETGFFIGKLGRENTIVLYEDGVEIPSDYSGVIFIRLADNWKNDLRKEIDSIYDLDE